jgi:ribosomal protein S18 acetylase RimI-like enzyme
MEAVAPMHIPTVGRLRPVDAYRDLRAIADLIELCFAATMDADGHEYLRQMRRAAQEADLLRLTPHPPEPSISGYVWEDNGKIIGNLSLIGMVRQAVRVYLIANVAVHPDYRRMGIARTLTNQAVDYVLHEKNTAAWLQVREDNPAALDLYTSLGFQERGRRSTWLFDPNTLSLPARAARGVEVTPRYDPDWIYEKAWLENAYSAEVNWALPLRLEGVRPGLWQSILRWLNGKPQQHWAARRNGQLCGLLTWEPSSMATDNLWLAAPRETELAAIPHLLNRAASSLPRRRTASLNYPAGRGEEAFFDCGGRLQQTLIWMEKRPAFHLV